MALKPAAPKCTDGTSSSSFVARSGPLALGMQIVVRRGALVRVDSPERSACDGDVQAKLHKKENDCSDLSGTRRLGR